MSQISYQSFIISLWTFQPTFVHFMTTIPKLNCPPVAEYILLHSRTLLLVVKIPYNPKHSWCLSILNSYGSEVRIASVLFSNLHRGLSIFFLFYKKTIHWTIFSLPNLVVLWKTTNKLYNKIKSSSIHMVTSGKSVQSWIKLWFPHNSLILARIPAWSNLSLRWWVLWVIKCLYTWIATVQPVLTLLPTPDFVNSRIKFCIWLGFN